MKPDTKVRRTRTGFEIGGVSQKPRRRPPRPLPRGGLADPIGRILASAASAEGLYKKLSGNGALAGRQPLITAGGQVTRLQAGPFESRAAAASACAKLAPQPCFAVEAALAGTHSLRGSPAPKAARRGLMIEPRVGDGGQRRLGAIGNAQPRRLDHRDVVSAVPDRQSSRLQSGLVPCLDQRLTLDLESTIRPSTLPVSFPSPDAQLVGLEPLETHCFGDRLHEGREPAGNQDRLRALPPHRPDQRAGSRDWAGSVRQGRSG